MPTPSYLNFASRILFKKNVLPHYLVFFVTKNCTAKCAHCLLGNRAESSNELTLEEIERMSYHMDPLLFLLITGGDPFIRDDIAEIVRILYQRPGFRNLGMPSNGFLTDKIVDGVEKILRTCPGIDFAVDISLDGIGADHDKIRGVPGLFERAINTYHRLEELRQHYRNFNLNVAVTISHFNHEKLDELYEYLSNDLKVLNINQLLCRGNPRDPQALDVNLDNYERFSQRLDEDLKKRLLSGYRGYPFADLVNAMKIVREKLIKKIRKEDRFVTPCYAGRLGVILYPNGDIAPCELRDEVLGNLRDEDYHFRDIIESAQSDIIRQRIDMERCHCTYECFLTNAVMFNPVMLSQVLWETSRIKFARLFQKER